MLEVLPFLLMFVSVAIAAKKGMPGFLGFSPVLLILGVYLGVNQANDNPYYYVALVRNWLPPVLILVSGIVVGLETSKRIAQIESIAIREQEIEDRASLLIQRVENLSLQKVQLEKKILKDDTFVLKMHEAALSLRGFDEDRIVDQLLRLLQEFLPCQSLSYYAYTQDTFVLKNGFHAKDRLENIIDPSSKLHHQLSEQEGTLSVRDYSYLALENIVLACPIQLNEKLGAILVHQMEFSDLIRSNILLMESLCQWGAHAIHDARNVNTKTSTSIQYFHSAFNSFFLKHMLEREFRLARRYDTFCTLLTITVRDAQNLVNSESFFQLLTHQFLEVYRNVDTIFYNELCSDRFHILLPMTEEENSHIAASKLDHRLEKLEYRPYQDPELNLQYSVGIFHVCAHTTDSEIQEFYKNHKLDLVQS